MQEKVRKSSNCRVAKAPKEKFFYDCQAAKAPKLNFSAIADLRRLLQTLKVVNDDIKGDIINN